MEIELLNKILNDPGKIQLLILLMFWTIPWKGVALWTAARNKQMYWFIGLLLINTFGILEIVYLFFLQPKINKNESGTDPKDKA